MRTYELGTQDDLNLLHSRLDTEYYIHLKEFNLRFAIILVTNENPKTGEILPAFKTLPYKVKLNNMKDRLIKRVDVEIQIDASYWNNCDIIDKEALFDGVLEQIEIVHKKGLPVYNDDGIVKMRLISPDMVYHGYSVIANRHGIHSPEVKSWIEFKDEFKDILM